MLCDSTASTNWNARLVEVGTTNRTHLVDYERALTGGGIIVKVHRSNFALEGFVADVPLAATLGLCLAGLLPGAAVTWALVRDIPIRNRVA